MGNSEREKFTPQKYLTQLAKDTIGIGVAQRIRRSYGNDPNRTAINIITGVAIPSQIFAPAWTRFAEVFPHPHFTAETIAICLDLGIDVVAILLAINGHIGGGLAAKVTYNAGTNALLDITSRKSPSIS